MARLTRQHINGRTGVIESFIEGGAESWQATVAPPHDAGDVLTDPSEEQARLSADNLAHPGCAPATCRGGWVIEDGAPS